MVNHGLIDEIKKSIPLLQLIGSATKLRKVAKTGGGELAGACPFCGGQDRFRVQPNHPQGGRWYCRCCGNGYWHDVIDFIMFRDNVNFMEALKILAPEEMGEVNRPQWVEASYEFLNVCIRNLWKDEGEGARNYLHNRGLNVESLKYWMVGYNPQDSFAKSEEWGLPAKEKIFLPRGIVIPCHDAAGLHFLKVRRRVGEPKYWILRGGQMWMFGLQNFLNTSIGFIFEGEFDAMLAFQTGFTGVGYASLPAGQDIVKDYQYGFNHIEDVIVAMDNDEPGKKAAEKLCRLPRFIKANPFPQGKDLSEFYQATKSMDAILCWLSEQVGLLHGTSKIT